MEERTPQLAPSELYDKRKTKDAAKLRAYNKILEQIYNRVRVISRLPNSQCSLLYTVPPFILGLPKLDLEDCVVYLIYQLRHAGYEVRYTPPNLLYISWLHHEKNYMVEQSPIMMAMMESAEKSRAELERKEKDAQRLIGARKSQRKQVRQTPGGLQSVSGLSGGGSGGGSGVGGRGPSPAAISQVLNRPMSNPTAGPPRPSAADYVPPSSFLENMTNPKNQTVYPQSMTDYFK
jgi:hypothetical protein